jgi:hypothetical protein
MSTYLRMWDKIKQLNSEQLDSWIRTCEPAKGVDIRFYDVTVLDVDLLEALREAKKDAA